VAPPVFFLVIDAIPHDLAREVWAAGALPGFQEPRPTVAVFPSLTAVAVPSLLGGIFDEVPPGYEARYYHPPSGEIRGGLGDPESEAAVAPFRARPRGFLGHTAVYLLRRGLAHAQIRWITHRFREEGGPWLGYLSATDGVAHFSGRDGLVLALRDIAASVDAARRTHEREHGELPGAVLCRNPPGGGVLPVGRGGGGRRRARALRRRGRRRRVHAGRGGRRGRRGGGGRPGR
jgi:hypothetical protein